jgi:hypothetical protein
MAQRTLGDLHEQFVMEIVWQPPTNFNEQFVLEIA